MNKWYMCNVVWYDGSDAYVSKFILQAGEVMTDAEGIHTEVTEESKRKTREYLQGNGEVLKFDPLYIVDFDNIIALKDYKEQPELQTAYDRFKNMWF